MALERNQSAVDLSDNCKTFSKKERIKNMSALRNSLNLRPILTSAINESHISYCNRIILHAFALLPIFTRTHISYHVQYISGALSVN